MFLMMRIIKATIVMRRTIGEANLTILVIMVFCDLHIHDRERWNIVL